MVVKSDDGMTMCIKSGITGAWKPCPKSHLYSPPGRNDAMALGPTDPQQLPCLLVQSYIICKSG